MTSHDERDDATQEPDSGDAEVGTTEGEAASEAPVSDQAVDAAAAGNDEADAPSGGADEAVVEALPEPDPLAELQARYDETEARLRTVSKAYRDLQAEMAAFRERMEARSKMASEQRAFDQARRFFDPVMNLKRSLAQPTDDVESLRSGLEMVQRQFMEAMEKLGLRKCPGRAPPSIRRFTRRWP